MDRECLPSVPKPRKRRTLDGEAEGSPRSVPVAKLLDNSVVAGASSRPAAPLHGQASNVRNSLMSKHDLSHTGSKSFIKLLGQGLGIESVRLTFSCTLDLMSAGANVEDSPAETICEALTIATSKGA